MTVPESDHRDRASAETIEVPATDASQRALHESIGHLYDELAIAAEADADEREALSDDLFEALEELYVATAEESVEAVEIRYDRGEE